MRYFKCKFRDSPQTHAHTKVIKRNNTNIDKKAYFDVLEDIINRSRNKNKIIERNIVA